MLLPNLHSAISENVEAPISPFRHLRNVQFPIHNFNHYLAAFTGTGAVSFAGRLNRLRDPAQNEPPVDLIRNISDEATGRQAFWCALRRWQNAWDALELCRAALHQALQQLEAKENFRDPRDSLSKDEVLALLPEESRPANTASIEAILAVVRVSMRTTANGPSAQKIAQRDIPVFTGKFADFPVWKQRVLNLVIDRFADIPSSQLWVSMILNAVPPFLAVSHKGGDYVQETPLDNDEDARISSVRTLLKRLSVTYTDKKAKEKAVKDFNDLRAVTANWSEFIEKFEELAVISETPLDDTASDSAAARRLIGAMTPETRDKITVSFRCALTDLTYEEVRESAEILWAPRKSLYTPKPARSSRAASAKSKASASKSSTSSSAAAAPLFTPLKERTCSPHSPTKWVECRDAQCAARLAAHRLRISERAATKSQ